MATIRIPFRWDHEKSELFRMTRGLGFEEIVVAIENGVLLDELDHPNQARYKGQRILVVAYQDYAYAVPCVRESAFIFLKTLFPSRVLTRRFLGGL